MLVSNLNLVRIHIERDTDNIEFTVELVWLIIRRKGGGRSWKGKTG